MGFRVVQECPQCGGAVELDEADRLLRCPYCEVQSFLFSDDGYRFVLPHRASNRTLIHVPYLRFRGSVFSCRMDGIHSRIVDITQLGVPFERFPVSLGLRPQAMKMRFAPMHPAGSFLKCVLKPPDLLARAERHDEPSNAGGVFHRALIGETVSLIYLPLYVEHQTLYDGITQTPIARLPKQRDVFASVADPQPGWKLAFLATLCPRCGWDLTGERDSVVLTCSNCESAWWAREGRLVQIDYETAAEDKPEALYLPFWKMSVQTAGIPIASYADFIRAAHQPMVIQEAWEDDDMIFWSPAFKIRPNRWLYLSKQLTLVQPLLKAEKRLPRQNLCPVTLPLGEAIQGITITLAGLAVNKKKVMPRLSETRVSVRGATLVYLPFQETAHDLIQLHTQVSINKKALEFGRFL